MNEPYTQTELIQALEHNRDALVAHCQTLEPAHFLGGTSEAWGPAHHLTHLTITHSRIASGFTNRDRLPEHAQPSRNFTQVRETYLTALRATPPALLVNTPFGPKLEPDTTSTDVITQFQKSHHDFLEAIRTWTDAELDTRGMKHPLAGLFSAREMLMFCAYHDQHHLVGIQKR